ncbi:MAG TPA: hypothetical protein VI215_06470 [Bacteroidota bacterium]
MKRAYHGRKKEQPPPTGRSRNFALISAVILLAASAYYFFLRKGPSAVTGDAPVTAHEPGVVKAEPLWIQRAYKVDALFHAVYTPCWEGAYGAIGDAYLFAATKDSTLLKFHVADHDLRKMCEGTWVDDRAWVCLAELIWWNFTGRTNRALVEDARKRYTEARREGRMSNHEGFWSWYNWPPEARDRGQIFTNSNMNQMVSVACWLYEASGERTFLEDALLVWNGDGNLPGIEKALYKGDGRWEGKPGLAAFGKQLPWEGAEYCSIGSCLYRETKDPRYKNIAIATAEWITNPANGWVDPENFFQIRMDGNGAFVNYLLDAYALDTVKLQDILHKVGLMLEHVWTNHNGAAQVVLHRTPDDGIRNGWNPYGGEDGYGVDEVGTVHAQGEAARAFGIFAYYVNQKH